uniref:Uncharacterized protein n=1 Tax=Amphimedon queenslandica TaxID=400682 RepID=A0A1X7V3Y1_AMPQE
METSLPQTVAKKKRVLPQWMLANQQHAHTTTVSPHKKQKRRNIIDSFYGLPMKSRVPLQDQRKHRSKESQEDTDKRLRKKWEYAQRTRSIANESADNREARLSDQRQRNQQKGTNDESVDHRESCLSDQRQRHLERFINQSEAQRQDI